MALFYKGILPSGKTVGEYVALNHMGIDVLPNANMQNMQYLFYNKATNKTGFYAAIAAHRRKYEGKNFLVQLFYGKMKRNIDIIMGSGRSGKF